jgi:hypothetical protein
MSSCLYVALFCPDEGRAPDRVAVVSDRQDLISLVATEQMGPDANFAIRGIVPLQYGQPRRYSQEMAATCHFDPEQFGEYIDAIAPGLPAAAPPEAEVQRQMPLFFYTLLGRDARGNVRNYWMAMTEEVAPVQWCVCGEALIVPKSSAAVPRRWQPSEALPVAPEALPRLE